MNFKLKKIEIENETNYKKSKIGGSPVFPLGFFQKQNLDEDLFIAQINLSEINNQLLPKKGFLYFFLNIDMYPYVPKVLYTDEEVREVFENINEGFEDYGEIEGYEIVPSNDDTGLLFCSEVHQNLALELESYIEVDANELISLLEFDSLELPFNVLNLGTPDGWYLFLIKKEDLKKLDFSKVEFISFGS